ncbi:MAG: c-type cytochrome [Flavobacterium sp.]|nr:c-type cytochrome [Pedobacter sp.]
MRTTGKVLVYLSIGIFIAIGLLLSYVKIALPDVAKSKNLKIEYTPARIQRGEYLANHVSLCVDCHSTRDWSKLSGPIFPDSKGVGGELFDETHGLPGKYYSPNITPYQLSNWTDGEIVRAVTTGVSKNGNALFPIMPYTHFREMDQEDIYSIISYIRTLPSQKSTVLASVSNFPMNFIINTIPVEADMKSMPSTNNKIAYGKYLVNAAACSECHSKKEKGENIKGLEFSGGNQFNMPGGIVITTANITPDTETGIGKWSKQDFLNRFIAYRDIALNPKIVSKTDFQTVMPWTMYSGMNDNDLEAIYLYLKTNKPVKNKVITFALE